MTEITIKIDKQWKLIGDVPDSLGLEEAQGLFRTVNRIGKLFMNDIPMSTGNQDVGFDGSKMNSPWSDKDIVATWKHYQNRVSYNNMAEKMGRNTNSIKGMVGLLKKGTYKVNEETGEVTKHRVRTPGSELNVTVDNRRHWTDSEIIQIWNLHQEGIKTQQLADRFGKSYNAVQAVVKRVKAGVYKIQGEEVVKPGRKWRGEEGTSASHWTETEDEKFKTLVRKNTPKNLIAQILGRSESAIRNRWFGKIMLEMEGEKDRDGKPKDENREPADPVQE